MNRTDRKTREGQIVKHSAQKTSVVLVERMFQDPRYRKTIRRSERLLAHDEKDETNVGDWVQIEETRPLSSRKCWRVVAVLERNREA